MNQEIVYDSNIMIGFIIVGILIKIFFNMSGSSNVGDATATIWGYGIVALSLFALMFITFSLATKINDQNKGSIFNFIKLLITNSLPIVATLSILIWIITLNSVYYNKINDKKISNEYYQYSNITLFLIIAQLSVLFMSLQSGPSQSKMKYTTYFFTVLNLIFVGIMNIILKFFTTDG
jgi:hypothetical protein